MLRCDEAVPFAPMKSGHQLTDIETFPAAVATTLAAYSISTAEEFLALDEVTDDLGVTLDIEPTDLDRALSAATDAVDADHESTLRAIQGAPGRPTGAVSPRSKQFDDYQSGRY